MECEDLKLLGYSKVETMGQHLVQRFITEDFKASVDELLASALSRKETTNREFPMFKKVYLGDSATVLVKVEGTAETHLGEKVNDAVVTVPA